MGTSACVFASPVSPSQYHVVRHADFVENDDADVIMLLDKLILLTMMLMLLPSQYHVVVRHADEYCEHADCVDNAVVEDGEDKLKVMIETLKCY